MIDLDKRTRSVERLLRRIESVAEETGEEFLVNTAAAISSLFRNGGNRTFEEDKKLLNVLEFFIPDFEAVISRMEPSSRRGLFSDLVGYAKDILPGTLAIWRNYDVQKEALVEVHQVLQEALPLTPRKKGFNFDVINMGDYYALLMTKRRITLDEVKKAGQLAELVFIQIEKYNVLDRKKFDESLAKLEVVTFLMDE